jgi:uncharacterized protein (DUF1800 family)
MGAAAAQSGPNAIAVEYFHVASRQYFMTASSAEMRLVDSGGAGGSWLRTGGQFSAYAGANDVPGLSPVCRFYGTPGRGPNTHRFTADAAECAAMRADPAWIYEGVSFYIATPQGGACTPGTTPVYRSYRTGLDRAYSNQRFTVDPTVAANAAAEGHAPDGVVMCSPLSASDLEADAVRLLRQATFGPSEGELARVAALGTSGWIEDQLSRPATQYPVYPAVPTVRPDTCIDNRTPPVTPTSFCARDNYTLFPLQLQFFRDAVAGPDQLRQRVAFALSQILVTSGVDNPRNYAVRHYQQILRDRAFGNYYDLLLEVTLSPVMGDYLDMANNNKADPAANIEPNENYAREILQLFSVGTFLLNPDGTRKADAAGRPLPTYDQDEIEGFAHVFTGWTYPTLPGQRPRNNNPRHYEGQMRPVDANHDFGSKILLSGVTAPAGMTMQQDLEFAHRNIFTHSNVGPFIGRQLIQKLVTSDPTPAYVARVAAVFANNGAGQRGDLRAVVRAILTDPEARGARKIDPTYGKLSEPILYLTTVARAFAGRSDGVFLRLASSQLSQFVFYSPSVFNYFPPEFVVPGTAITGPEFGIQTTTTAINRANIASGLVFTGTIAPDPAVFGATGTAIDLAAYQSVAGDAGALAERMNRYLMAGRMSAAMRAAIVSAVDAIPASDSLNRARTAVYLVLVSPQFQVER